MRLGIFMVGLPILCALANGLFGQEYRATLLGRVEDPTGLAVPGAKVSATNTATNVSSSTTTNAQGSYTIPYLPPGQYHLRVEVPGFKAVQRGPIELRLDERVQIDVQLELGVPTETVQVTAEVPLVDLASASAGQVIDRMRITDLPLQKGVLYHLMALSPGLNRTGTTMSDDNPFDWSITQFTVSGSTAGNIITIDGAATGGTIGSGTQPSFTPPQETVAEMRVQTAAFDATQGWTQSANVQVSLKSGTNDVHGSGHYQWSSPALSANLYFNTLQGIPKGDFVYRRFDGNLTGPVEIPKVYSGRNRTFFSVGYEKMKQGTLKSQLFTVPTEAERKGDFSDLLKIGSNYQIYDPATRRASGTRFVSDPLPGNIIPESRLSPIALGLLKYWPQPNTEGRADGIDNYFSDTRGQTNNYWAFTARVDHNLSDRHRVYVSTHGYKRHNLDYDIFNNPATGGAWFIDNYGAAFDDVYTISPNLIMNVRAGYERYPRRIDSPKEEPRNWSYAANGFAPYMDELVPKDIRRFPQFSPSGYTGIPAGPVGLRWDISEVYSYALTFSKTTGNHFAKFGLEGRRYNENIRNIGTDGTGSFNFSTNWTRGPFDNSSSSPIGQGLASMLLGLPTGGSIARRDSSADRSHSWALFFQEDWRVTRRLTLNLGVRYEYEGPTRERYNRSVRDFDFAAVLPIAAQVEANYANNPTPEIAPSAFKVRGGLRFAGVGGQPSTLWEEPKNVLMPRFGFAYQISPRTVMRGGYGIYYDVGGIRRGTSIQSGYSLSTPLQPSLDGGLTFIATLENPFPDGVQDPPGNSLGAMTDVGRNISFFNPKPARSYLQRWQLGIQRELPLRVLIDASYVGSRGTRIGTSRDLNALPNEYLSTSPFRDDAHINYLTDNLPNPFYPLLPGTNLSGTLVSRQQLLRPYPQFGSISVGTNEGYTWYHGLQLSIQRRFANGFTGQSSYTWSKFMAATTFLNAADPRPVEQLSNVDYPHNFTFSGIYELPVGRGKRFFSGVSRAVDLFVGGWQVQGMFRYQTGPLVSFGNVIFLGNGPVALPKDQRTVQRWFNTDAGFERNSARQLEYNLRTLPPFFSGVRTDDLNTWDLSGLKRFAVTERVSAEFRAEFQNAFNQVWLGAVNTNPTASNFGQVNTENSVPRLVRLGLRFQF
ncbi:MAG: TonB-dependent receptor domain-containing protein [Rhodospirillales bacterium]